jgi:pyruvate dehydrogenase (quinone)
MVDVNVNPNEPPLPGRVDYEQAKQFAQAFLKGQPRKATIATGLVSDKIEQLKSQPGSSPPPLPRPLTW